jgi:D-alanyl-D-alanine carboxypeptidase/D-alanyl-D-alanine-endopeptidase (penicillin-binding protein 4)
MNKPFYFLLFIIVALTSCSLSKNISRQTYQLLISDSTLKTGHVGISIYEPSTNSFWYNYNADKYFIPASNTKLFTLYAGMKYLGDSIIGLKYFERNDTIFVLPTADPTLLHPDFSNQPVIDFLKKEQQVISIIEPDEKIIKFGSGWAWDDYNDSYMAERNALPIFGNLVRFHWELKNDSIGNGNLKVQPEITGYKLTTRIDTSENPPSSIIREVDANDFLVSINKKDLLKTVEVPFETKGIQTATLFLKNNYNNSINSRKNIVAKNRILKSIKTQPTDSLFKIMMHRSDNLYAEQTLIMVSNQRLGFMSDEEIIDTILNTDLKNIPQKPRWVDGSGLSRYTLFTPLDFVYIINKIQTEFGTKRLKTILPTGGEGTLKKYFNTDSGFIYAKTGSLSNNFALSGLITTKKNKQLVFSIIVNNYKGSYTSVKKTIEMYLKTIRNKY